MTTRDQLQALLAVCDGIVDAVKAAGDLGAPSGVIYAALMAQGCSLEAVREDHGPFGAGRAPAPIRRPVLHRGGV